MGNKGAKNKDKTAATVKDKDLKFLATQTGLSVDQVKGILNKFNANNPDGKLDKREFVRLYDELRPESAEALDEISESVFRSFDTDKNGFISFNEFLVAYALTSRGDQAQKLDYAFNLYDADGNGYLDSNEVNAVLHGMLDLLGADKKYNSQQLAQECLKDLDASHDGKITKQEFIQGLLKNYSLRALMSPFN